MNYAACRCNIISLRKTLYLVFFGSFCAKIYPVNVTTRYI